ncbi:MAG: DUF2953 domain-containing protein [Gemmatimonadota bacterium]|nr:DUF2953 domain-containing protein [Gemmatimonadota bacterium]
MLTTILIAIGLVLGIPLAIIALFLCLPIRIRATGYYRENDYSISGFARGCAGLCGIICDIDKKGIQLRVVIGRWTAWRPREKPPSSEPTTESERDTATEPQRDRPKSYPTTKPSYWSRLQTLRAKTKQYLNYAADARPILTRFMKRLLKTISLQHAELNLELGTDDPAFTGRLFGYIEATKCIFGKRIRISLTPDFLQPRFAGSGSLKLSIYLHRLIFAALALAIRGGLWRAKIWWTERKNRRKAGTAQGPSPTMI